MKKVLECSVGGFWSHGCVTHGAALAFYALFVLVPVPIFAVSAAATLVGGDLARAEVVEVLRALAGDQMAATLAEALDTSGELTSWRGAALFGLAALVFGATAFFVELQDTLNEIWGVPAEPFEWGRFVRSRLVSFVMVAASGGALLVLTLGGALARGFGERLRALPWAPASGFGAGTLLIAFLVMAALLSLVFRYVPNAGVSFREVWLGSLATALLLVCGNELIGLYLRHTRLATAYGAAGSLVLTLTWIYYSALAFLFGAELTRCLGAASSAGPSVGRSVDASLDGGSRRGG